MPKWGIFNALLLEKEDVYALLYFKFEVPIW